MRLGENDWVIKMDSITSSAIYCSPLRHITDRDRHRETADVEIRQMGVFVPAKRIII